ncbi:MAG: diaminopimelate decarboxylase [Muribaculaceae bacterium]|nr:diaminopimelate decarboxylase [Muribaculaceae bacterium]
MSTKNIFPIELFQDNETPFYYYNLDLLRQTINHLKHSIEKNPEYIVHYAIKANANPVLLKIIAQAGLGADCVSGGEILAAIQAGISPAKIVYAGVGKTDKEINIGLDNDIFCFNVESIPELEVINQLALRKDVIARVALRINPEVEAHTHSHITTGKAENKFGISLSDLDRVFAIMHDMTNVSFVGLHFHIGSQILDMNDFEALCHRVNSILSHLYSQGVAIQYINVGGGLGIDYESPIEHPIPDFDKYFNTFRKHIQLQRGQTLHFELGRAIVAQCGTLISRVIFVKEGESKKFVIIDAGMTDLIRPALYDAHHHIANITSYSAEQEVYDIVGPICESSDVFGRDIKLPVTSRGDVIAIFSAGAYGESMASQYNCRPITHSIFSE